MSSHLMTIKFFSQLLRIHDLAILRGFLEIFLPSFDQIYQTPVGAHRDAPRGVSPTWEAVRPRVGVRRKGMLTKRRPKGYAERWYAPCATRS